MSPALAGRFLSTGPLGKYEKWIILIGGKNLLQVFWKPWGQLAHLKIRTDWGGGWREGATFVFPVL